MRAFILALQFLTRLPAPRGVDAARGELPHAAAWFPVVGLIVGAIVGSALTLGGRVDPWLGALAGCFAWVLVTGALHLDGLADLADALGAAHRDPGRFFAVLRDPHVGTFGIVAIVLACVAKLVLLMLAAKLAVPVVAVVVIPAWARYGAALWSRVLPPLTPGTASAFAAPASWGTFVIWGSVLLGASIWLAPMLLMAPLAVAAWWLFLQRRLGGVTGDCLGAGVELVEVVTLAALVSAPY